MLRDHLFGLFKIRVIKNLRGWLEQYSLGRALLFSAVPWMPRLSAGFSACGFPAVRDLPFPDGPGRRGKGGILKILIALGSQFLILSFFFVSK